MLITAYARSGKTADAENMLNDRVAKDGKDVDAMLLLASMRAQGGNFSEAERLLNQAIELRPDNIGSYLDLIRLLTAQRKLKEAAEFAAGASGKFPDSPDLSRASAIAYDTSGDLKAAQAAYEKILARRPNDLVAANNLAALIADVAPAQNAQLSRARQLAEKFRNSSEPVLLDTLGWVLVRQGNFDDAAVLLEKAVSLAPDNQQIKFHYAMALKEKGLTKKAKETLTEAVAGTPEYRGLDEARQALAALPQ
jgi:tetratricopeptide (TPR) repeat protein